MEFIRFLIQAALLQFTGVKKSGVCPEGVWP